MDARIELDDLIGKYLRCDNAIFIDFAHLLIRNHDYIINSFVMVEKHGPGKIKYFIAKHSRQAETRLACNYTMGKQSKFIVLNNNRYYSSISVTGNCYTHL